uniref:Uncharacterized protein n=1 Tax=Romanomermis culicivorax TaxID=13658 RepID=A0A915JJ48_ROMCU
MPQMRHICNEMAPLADQESCSNIPNQVGRRRSFGNVCAVRARFDIPAQHRFSRDFMIELRVINQVVRIIETIITRTAKIDALFDAMFSIQMRQQFFELAAERAMTTFAIGIFVDKKHVSRTYHCPKHSESVVARDTPTDNLKNCCCYPADFIPFRFSTANAVTKLNLQTRQTYTCLNSRWSNKRGVDKVLVRNTLTSRSKIIRRKHKE